MDLDGVALLAEGYAGKYADKLLGMFVWQEEVVEGRPAYKKEEEEHFLFYTTFGEWTVGPDTSKTKGWWKATSSARTPGAITEPWKVHNGSAWVEVPDAKITKAVAAVKAALAAAEARIRENVAGRAEDAGTDAAEIAVTREMKTSVVEGQRMFIEARLVAVATGRPRIAA